MAAIMRVVNGVGGSTVLDLNAPPRAGIMNARGDKALGDVTMSDEVSGSDGPPPWWQPTTNPAEIASRRIVLPLQVWGDTQDQVAARISALHTATSRPWVLEVRRHGATQSGWIRCQPARLPTTAPVNAVGSVLCADVTLQAVTEPYSVGQMVDTGTLTFTQDASAGGAFYADVTVSQGDSLAPCLLRTDLSGPVGAGLTTSGSLWGIRRHGTPSNLTGLVEQGQNYDTITVSGANVTHANVTDSAFSGGAGRRFTFAAGAGVGDWARIQWNFNVNAVEAPGEYRIVARLRRGGGGAGLTHYVTPIVGGYRMDARLFPDDSGVDLRVLDLGLTQIPVGQAPNLSAPLGVTSRASAGTIGFEVARGSAGAGTFDVDWIALVPAGEDMGHWRLNSASSVWAFADGYSGDSGFTDVDLVTGSTPTFQGSQSGMSTLWTGGVPRLAPGVNRVYCVQGLRAGVIWPKTQSMTARLAYWPRWRWLP